MFVRISVLVFLAAVIINCKPINDRSITCDLNISNVSVINVRDGSVLPSMDIAIRGDTIVDIVAHGSAVLTSAKTIDGSGKYIIPGLWDMHAHSWFAYKKLAPVFLSNGVVGVRDMFGDPASVKVIKDEMRNGKLVAPNIIASGAIIDGASPTWPDSHVATNGEMGRQIVRKQISEGADFIKIYSGLDKITYQAIAAECKKLNVSMAGHIPFKVKLEEAIGSGQQSAEHFFGVMEFCSSERDKVYEELQNMELKGFEMDKFLRRMRRVSETFDSSRVEPLVELLRNNNMWMSPTCVVNRMLASIGDSTFRNDKRIESVPNFLSESWKSINLPKEDQDNAMLWYKRSLSIMKRMVDGNVRFLAGTDTGNPFIYPGFSLHDELEIFVKDAGFTPLQSLQTATVNPSIFLRTRGGVVEKGRSSSLVLLDSNPLSDIANTRSIHGVILKGIYHSGDSLRSIVKANVDSK